MIGKKILVTGSNGMLGTNLMKSLKAEIVGLSKNDLDITNFDALRTILNEIKPDIIIHTAAYTNVEKCETHKDEAYKINTLGTQNLVNYCINSDILFVYISSTGNYGVSKIKNRYTEFDKVEPTTIHHKSKYEAEKSIENHLNKYLIIRTGWLYGGDKEHSKNFVYKRLLEAQANGTIYSDDSQIGNPTYVGDLVAQIELLIEKNVYGVFNCVNEAQNISRYDYVKKIIEIFGVDCDVNIAPEGMFKRVAPVSKNESAQNYKLDLMGLNIMGNWEKSLSNYIVKLKKEI